MTIRIALDAMGGDSLAVPNLQGALAAVTKPLPFDPDLKLKVFLCGPQGALEEAVNVAAENDGVHPEMHFDSELFWECINDGRLEFVDAPETVGMDESPSVVVRQKKNSSMARCFELVRDKKAEAAVSAGNSGAMMAYGISVLKRLPEVKRPAIMCHFPSNKGVVALLDAGANVDCTPAHLEQFAKMGRVYMQTIFEKETVRIALLNIGEEETKGNELVKEAHKLLKASMPDNYVGFIEGREILTGDVDVIVCDGFVGNVVLKTIEGVAKTVRGVLKEEFSKNAIWGLGAWLAKGGFMAMSSKFDYREYGAAPLIGLQGLGLVAHGSSDAKAIMNAIRIGSLYSSQNLMQKLSMAFSEDTARSPQAVSE